MNTAELRVKVKDYVDQLSPITLRIAADFLAYLVKKESEESTDDLPEIPGLLEGVRQAENNAAEGKGSFVEKLKRNY